MESINKQKWEDLNLTRDEVNSFGKALQKEEFRNLLIEYVKEINDPENRRQYEDEITQLESERGVDVTFIHPSPGYVIKTSVDGKSKAFINVCTNENVGTPSSTPDIEKGHQGSQWSLPYCMAPPREDFDKKNNICTVYDVIFHPDTLLKANKNEPFKRLVNETALGAVEENFKVTLDKNNFKFPKMQFKGIKHATVIRKRKENYKPTECLDIPNYPYPPIKEDRPSPFVPKRRVKPQSQNNSTEFTTPTYSLKHRSNIDMQHFTNDPLTQMCHLLPDELVVTIDLPLLKCAADASVDVTEQSLFLVSEQPAKYKLNLKLPYFVDRNNGSAKFDIIRKSLTVTLPVSKTKTHTDQDLEKIQEDSGVESDICCARSKSVSSDQENKNESHKDQSLLSNQSNKHSDNDNVESNKVHKKFLKPEHHYLLPNFSCQLQTNTLIFTFHVPNVIPASVDYCFLHQSSGYHLSFISVGSGYFPVYYALYFSLSSPNQIEANSFCVEVWDNNVIAQIRLKPTCSDDEIEYYAGIDERNIRKFMPETSTKRQSKQELQENEGNEPISQFSGPKKDADDDEKEDTSIGVSLSTSSHDESSQSPIRQSPKSRTISESQPDEILRNRFRGILKIGRSLSESSVDDYASWSNEKEKTKKTVRFSEVISKQTFRMNSSILGQRKKNQRKTRNKKRAQERKLSESGGESEGELEIASEKGNLNINRSLDMWFKEPDLSSSDVSEVSEVSDISESDDGSKEELKPFTPCSNKKNHKRRGKKSARKNAATAKFQYRED